METYTQAVHAGDRRKLSRQIPITTPIYTAASFFCESMDELNCILGREEEGYCYSRYDNPRVRALEELMAALMDRLKLIVRATSLGDVHSMMLYPVMSSHREIAPRQRERMGIRDSLVRLSLGIEAPEDICADLEQALS